MHIRWSKQAADDFSSIVAYIRRDNPTAALRVAQSIYKTTRSLADFPNLGKVGRVEDTRELPLPPLPFILVYRLSEQAVEVVRILHGAQRWP